VHEVAAEAEDEFPLERFASAMSCNSMCRRGRELIAARVRRAAAGGN
jgi:hypothetical protein